MIFLKRHKQYITKNYIDLQCGGMYVYSTMFLLNGFKYGLQHGCHNLTGAFYMNNGYIRINEYTEFIEFNYRSRIYILMQNNLMPIKVSEIIEQYGDRGDKIYVMTKIELSNVLIRT